MATRDLAISGRQSEADLPQAGNVRINGWAPAGETGGQSWYEPDLNCHWAT
jgi:hypothetical protein